MFHQKSTAMLELADSAIGIWVPGWVDSTDAKRAMEALDDTTEVYMLLGVGPDERGETLAIYGWLDHETERWAVSYEGRCGVQWSVWTTDLMAHGYFSALHEELDAIATAWTGYEPACWFDDDECTNHNHETR